MAALKVNRSVAMALFALAGWKSSDRWDNKRMESKLSDLGELMTEDKIAETPADLKDTLVSVLANIKENGTFSVLDDESSKEPDKAASSAPSTDSAAKEAEKAEAKAKKEAEKAEAKAAKEAEKAAAKAKKDAEKAAKAAEAKKPAKGRPYFAGVVIRKHGISGGYTPEMVKEVDELTGKANEKESLAWLRIAASVCAGYTEIDTPSAPAAE